MKNCKVGDLAIVVRDNDQLENLGLLVRVVEAYGEMQWRVFNWKTKRYYKRKFETLFSWTVEVVSDTSQIIYSEESGNLYGLRVGEVPDAYLRPLPTLTEDDSFENSTTLPKDIYENSTTAA